MSKREPPFRDDSERDCKRVCLSRKAMASQLINWLKSKQTRHLIARRVLSNRKTGEYLHDDTLHTLWYSFGRAAGEINLDAESESENTSEFRKMEEQKRHDEAAEEYNKFKSLTQRQLEKEDPNRKFYRNEIPDLVKMDKVRTTSRAF